MDNVNPSFGTYRHPVSDMSKDSPEWIVSEKIIGSIEDYF
jgi:hypothetical protein